MKREPQKTGETSRLRVSKLRPGATEVQLRQGGSEPRERLLTVAEVAGWLALGEGWVREHAAELGGVKIGDDPRSPFRFTHRGIEAWLEAHRLRSPVPRPAWPTRTAERVKLLPLPGERR